MKIQAFIGSLNSTEAILMIGLAVCNSTNRLSALAFRKICIFVFWSEPKDSYFRVSKLRWGPSISADYFSFIYVGMFSNYRTTNAGTLVFWTVSGSGRRY